MLNDLIHFNKKLLEDALNVLKLLDDTELACCPTPLHESSIGQHLRHIADHFSALIYSNLETVDYQHRNRFTRMETSTLAATHRFRTLKKDMTLIEQGACRINAETGYQAQSVVLDSTRERELAFVASHTIHHFALVALLLRALQKSPPENLGIAPATLAAKPKKERSV